MKAKIILLVVLLSGITASFVLIDNFQTTTGPHGGSLKPAENFYIEMKTSYPGFYTYLLNRQCKPIGNKGISCEMKFLFPDSTNLDVELQPYLEDGFRTESNILGYHSCRVTFHAFDKVISAWYENENAIVQKK